MNFSDLVGIPASVAVRQLKEKYPTFNIHAIPEDTITTDFYESNRITIRYDPKTNLVSQVPHTG